jgi:hypothetical protein
MKTTRIQREALAKLAAGKTAVVCWETYFALCSAYLVAPVNFAEAGDAITLTPDLLLEQGRAIAGPELAKCAKRNAAARARSQMMRDLGMKRTRSGGWE